MSKVLTPVPTSDTMGVVVRGGSRTALFKIAGLVIFGVFGLVFVGQMVSQVRFSSENRDVVTVGSCAKNIAVESTGTACYSAPESCTVADCKSTWPGCAVATITSYKTQYLAEQLWANNGETPDVFQPICPYRQKSYYKCKLTGIIFQSCNQESTASLGTCPSNITYLTYGPC